MMLGNMLEVGEIVFDFYDTFTSCNPKDKEFGGVGCAFALLGDAIDGASIVSIISTILNAGLSAPAVIATQILDSGAALLKVGLKDGTFALGFLEGALSKAFAKGIVTGVGESYKLSCMCIGPIMRGVAVALSKIMDELVAKGFKLADLLSLNKYGDEVAAE
jgi:hypothetical protein